MRRVVVTGLGVLSPLGSSGSEFWESLAEGKSAIRPLEREYPGPLNIKHGAYLEIEDLDDEPFSHYLKVAANAALQNSGLSDVSQSALLVGTAASGQRTMDRTFERLYRKQNPRLLPSTLMRFQANRSASNLAQELGLHGPNYTICSGCSSSAQAIGLGSELVRSGQVESALVGGTEAPFGWVSLKSWEALRVVDKQPCRPFSADRAGLSLGEGSAVLVLESLDSALNRGARILAELLGYATNTSGVGQAGLSLDGPVNCMSKALELAGLKAEDIDYINAHGTGTRQNDALETKAIHSVFGDHATNLSVSSTKSAHGHTLGAAGAFEAVATICALRNQMVPPTLSFTTADPECDLDCVTEGCGRVREVRNAISNSFAFGGTNACLVFSTAPQIGAEN